MALPTPDIHPSTGSRPVVSDVSHNSEDRHLSIVFQPGQRLPAHRNPARVVITALEGDGEITIAGDGPRVLPTGAVVQLDPGVEHSIVAGDHGLELRVDRLASCCERC
jgi:quercetin dioxygenase-like cupin family protein